ncbi:MAG: hypothetical protein HY869_20165 [Chloroflexi bacterium]|nr:hypothetical protein [Chloroflexota bacterium]
MKKTFLLSMSVCVLLTACRGLQNAPTVFPSLTAGSTSTPTFTSRTFPGGMLENDGEQQSQIRIEKSPIPPTKDPPTPTFTPFPTYHTKKVIFEYYTAGHHSLFDVFYSEPPVIPNIILYDDGQMIVNGEQKVLSANEIKNFLSRLDALGFFSIESNQKHDPTDKLYDFGKNYQKSFDGPMYCILVNVNQSRHLCVYEPNMQFVIPKMQRILEYLDEYKPTGLTPYYPDRILLSIESFSPNSDEAPAIVTPWDKRFPSLVYPAPRKYIYYTPVLIMYIEGDMAKEIYIFMANSHSGDVFIQDGKKYRVQLAIVWPHETVVNAYQ